ncbi:Uma2 family endonuclease [Streptomyces sp. JH002]|uniref:Uma2 family endonuclease n=1 Tax=Streptomyces sp. JH002 TaxID=2763259 RepID=UPI003D800349
MVHDHRRAAVRVTLDHGQLRSAARLVARWTGVRVDVPGAPEPPPRGKRYGVLRQIEAQLAPLVAPDLVPLWAPAVARPDAGPDAYLTPDLAVCPYGFLGSDESLLHPRAVELAVVVRPVAGSGTAADVSAYAGAGVRLLVRVDPLRGRWSLNSHPRGGRYRVERRGAYGEGIPLPVPLGCGIETARLPRYAAVTAQ